MTTKSLLKSTSILYTTHNYLTTNFHVPLLLYKLSNYVTKWKNFLTTQISNSHGEMKIL